MPKPGWLNDNEHRSYPFISDILKASSAGFPLELPDSTIVDFGSIAGLDADYDPATHSVYLHEVRRAGDVFEFEFHSTAPKLVGYGLIFSRKLSESEFALENVEAEIVGALLSASVPGTCPGGIIWEGFLVTGQLDDLAALLDSGETIDGSAMTLITEPALTQTLDMAFARSINLANGDRTRSESPEGCSESGVSFAEGTVFVNAQCLQGDLKFKEGYNCFITQQDISNSITIAACNEIELFEGESSLTGGRPLSGGPFCDELIRTINGISGPVVRFQAGQGVRIIPGDAANTICIDVDLHDMAICVDEDFVSSLSLGGP
jgi:hypothetical protein